MGKFNDGNLVLADNQTLTLGDGDDVTLSWDGTNLDLIPAATGTTNFQLGDGTEVIGLRFGASGQVVTSFDTTTTLGTSDAAIPTQNAVKVYVDTVMQGIDPKESCVVATAAALPAYTRTTNNLTADAFGSINTAGIDGKTDLALGDRVLLKNGAADADNGIYETDKGRGPNGTLIVTYDNPSEGISSATINHIIESEILGRQ